MAAGPATTARSCAPSRSPNPKPVPTPATCRPPRRPTDDGAAYILNGTKHYITNGGIADVLTVMARTPDAAKAKARR